MHHRIRSQIISLSDWADATTALVRRFVYVTLEPYVTDPNTLDEVTNQWTMTDSVLWVQAYLDDEFSRQMKWAQETTVADDKLLTRMMELLTPYLGATVLNVRKNRTTLRNDLLEVVDPVVILVTEKVIDCVRPNPWWVWHLSFRHDVVLIESDDDYRIKLFNEKVESGDWSIS